MSVALQSRRFARQHVGVEKLLQAATDFLAAVLGTVGLMGRPRRRAGIVADLDLLDRIRDSDAFGASSRAHVFLVSHIELEVAKLAKAELTRKKKIPWGSIMFALIIGAPLAYLTYKLDQADFRWYSVFPGAIAGLMFVAVLGMVFDREDMPREDVLDGTDDSPVVTASTAAALTVDGQGS